MEMEHSHLDDDWREVKAIHDYYRHKESGQMRLLIQWKDDNRKEWRWYAECDCPTLLFNFLKENGEMDDEYEVEAIIDSFKNDHGEMEYLVKWIGLDMDKSTWVKQSKMKCDELIEDFENGNFFWYPKRRVVSEITDEVPGLITYYEVLFENQDEPDQQHYSIDDVYMMPNGREALCKFHKKFL